jgi:hypothetical protein
MPRLDRISHTVPYLEKSAVSGEIFRISIPIGTRLPSPRFEIAATTRPRAVAAVSILTNAVIRSDIGGIRTVQPAQDSSRHGLMSMCPLDGHSYHPACFTDQLRECLYRNQVMPSHVLVKTRKRLCIFSSVQQKEMQRQGCKHL